MNWGQSIGQWEATASASAGRATRTASPTPVRSVERSWFVAQRLRRPRSLTISSHTPHVVSPPPPHPPPFLQRDWRRRRRRLAADAPGWIVTLSRKRLCDRAPRVSAWASSRDKTSSASTQGRDMGSAWQLAAGVRSHLTSISIPTHARPRQCRVDDAEPRVWHVQNFIN
ncbi:hypothetical protein JDV02_002035 [Purpureocillium takamizusanense]|uniref:Uncharacterized protein n=1 Tax=Purpureocillium takamizusanense TaxID=2060973 RepID=A0A9Q8QA38_9HYPO|nr:uncharacterized protein JDV02_002035 [Purpureocillium takamizusanense]UNI15507.1 hypothetical protein JDV02_002035 [Purpureocillium takamizusanense]